MDPIHLDKARMTKTPLPSLARWRVGGTKRWGVGGTNCSFIFFLFLLTHDKPFPQPQWAFPQTPTIVGWWIPSAPEKHENTPGSACVNASCKSARNLEVYTHTSWLNSTVKHIYVKGSSILDNLHKCSCLGRSHTGLEICSELDRKSWGRVLRPEKVECRVFFEAGKNRHHQRGFAEGWYQFF